MASSRSKGGPSTSLVDVSQHPGFVNLGNTCFLNSALQAISVTQSLKQLYLPIEQDSDERILLDSDACSHTPNGTPGPSSRRNSIASDLIHARCKSPVLRLADEEHGRSFAISRPGSTSIEASMSAAIARQAVSNPTPADIQSIQRSAHGQTAFAPSSSDLPLNTAFRQVMEKTWARAAQSAAPEPSSSKASSTSAKRGPINPKRLLNEISTKYDQYSEYRQQDGHELLRHLLDSLRMEELDVIKKIQPPVPLGKRRKNTQQTPFAQPKEPDEQLKPLVDNLFCGKLLSFVVCEGCRHVSHTYEDFYDISLSLRPDADAKEGGKRQRIRNMADRWRRNASGKANGISDAAKPLADSLAMLRDGEIGSYSDTEPAEEPVRRPSSRLGRSISRPKSAADRARIDANSKEGAKTFIKRQMQHQSDSEAPEKAMEGLSLDGPDKKRDPPGQGNAVSLLRAVSGRRTPASRAASPLRRPADGGDEAEKDNLRAQQDHRHHPLQTGHHKKKPSKHTQYLSKLLAESPPQPQQANLGALLWGRKTPMPADASPDYGHRRKQNEDLEAQQAGTGLVRSLYEFTSVEVLDGQNSFACKRCWRQLNPPSAEERERLRLRRLRRGKREDESEMSSDDESSSDEEEKELRQKVNQNAASSMNGSSISSLASLSDEPATDSSRRPSLEESSVLAQENGQPLSTLTLGRPAPAVIVSSSEAQSGAETPTSASTFTIRVNPQQDVATDDAAQAVSPAPLLQAPKPVVAATSGLRLGAVSSASSDDGSNDAHSSDESSDADDGKVNDVSRQRSIRYADEGISTITKPANLTAPSVRRKRSTHSLQCRALKRFLIAETPKVFVFHFKRFQATGRGFSFATSFKKIDDYVSFPEYLDVKPWLAPPREEYDRHGNLKLTSDPRALRAHQREMEHEIDEKRHHLWGWRSHHDKPQGLADDGPKTKYRLYAVVVHQGSMSGGHYTAYVLSDRASDSLKAKAEARSGKASQSSSAQTSDMPPDTANGKEQTSSKAPTVGNGSASLKSTEDGNTTAASTPSPLAGSSSTRVDPLSSVSSLGSEIGEGITPMSTVQPSPEKASQTKADNGEPVHAHASPSAAKSDDRRWIYTSDTVVRAASIEEVLKAQAYMLFYEQL